MHNHKAARFICLIFTCLFTCLLTASPVYGWGKNGHRIVGLIAERHLTDTAKVKLKPLLGGDTLPEITTWADEMRSSPDAFWQKETPRWHYINLDQWSEFKQYRASVPYTKAVTNIYNAILRCITVLQSEQSSQSEREKYLRILTHLVGDAHQPLHAGRAADRGGNNITLYFFGERTNLHALWDSKLIESEKLSFTEFSDFIDTGDSDLISRYLSSSISGWLQESQQLATQIYAVKAAPDQRWQYLYDHLPTVKQRLLQGGIRLAGLLNLLFDPKARAGIHAIPANKLN